MIESHPFEPWLPGNAKLLMLGTFPPAESAGVCPGIILISRMICGESSVSSTLMTSFIS